MKNGRTLTTLILLLFAGLFGGTVSSSFAASTGTLRVPLAGFKSDRGQVVVKLFLPGDDVPRGPGSRQLTAKIKGGKARVAFDALPHGTYALFAFHDENQNGTVDHNFLGFPKEALGFSNGFRVSLLSGIPDFDDLKFRFDEKHPTETISMH